MPPPVLPAEMYNPFKTNPGLTNPFARPPSTFNPQKEKVRAAMPGLANAADSVMNAAGSAVTLGLGDQFKVFLADTGKDILVYGIAILFVVFGLKGVFK